MFGKLDDQFSPLLGAEDENLPSALPSHQQPVRGNLSVAIPAIGELSLDTQTLIPPCTSGAPGMLDKALERSGH